MMYGSTMFGKLWEWIMGIIAWIMSKFSRNSNASNASNASDASVKSGGDSSEVDHVPSQESEHADVSSNAEVASS